MIHQEHLKRGHVFIGWHLDYERGSLSPWLYATPLYMWYSWRGKPTMILGTSIRHSVSEETRQERMKEYLEGYAPSPDRPPLSGFVPA